jgi:beta-glucosidase
MAEAAYTFPKSFLWGTATSGYQVEGGSEGADLWDWEQQPGAVLGGDRSGLACDWWAGRRWEADLDTAAADGHNALRFSVEWSRVEPTPARWDEDALDHYRQMAKGLRDRGLTPMVTLHHFASPRWASNPKRNVWETGEVVALFERYVRKVAGALGEYVDLWCTINEPNSYFFQCWVQGALPPGRRNIGLALVVAGNILRAHAAAYKALHEVQPQAQVGLPIHFRPTLPAHPGFAPDEWVARSQYQMFSTLFPDAIATGRMRRIVRRPLLVPEAQGTQDFVALQYYSTDVVRFDLSNPRELFGRRTFPAGSEEDGSGIYASYAPGLFSALKWAHGLGLPIYITENGIGGEEDGLRRRYIISHLRQLWRAVNFNWDVRGYFHWSLLDNFEWDRGWQHRFGLYALDRETQARTPRQSARLYSEIARSGALSSSLVQRYAPELLETMFPG